MAYWQWGSPDAGHVVLCVHGLSRQGRDFDVLAQGLCDAAKNLSGGASTGIRVICPDVAGRGGPRIAARQKGLAFQNPSAQAPGMSTTALLSYRGRTVNALRFSVP